MAGKHTTTKTETKSENTNNNKQRPKKKKNKALKIILIILLVILIILGGCVAGGYWYIQDKLGKIQQEEIDVTQVGIDEDVSENLSEYRNIALFGIDSRADDYGLGNRSDCIIIASINNITKEVKLISVYRDSYLEVTESKRDILDKVTHAYSYGGAQNAVKALNTNLDLNITEYVTANFDAVIAAVNALGGVTIDIEDAELQYINGYIDATSSSSGVSSSHISSAGKQTLDGVQAVAYSRIRYTAGGDYKRTERMRNVLEAMLNKVKQKSLGEINDFLDIILPRISTNISSSSMISMIPEALNYKVTTSIGWPYEVKGITLDRWYGVPVTLEENVKQLHEELFGEVDYQVSDTVKEISDSIIKKTGYQ